MIRYTVTYIEMEKKIIAKSNSWLERAEDAKMRCLEAGKFISGPPDWSEIKQVYMELQSNKCAYCERRLEEFNIEHDVEHFRPKNAVKSWPISSDEKGPKYTFPTGTEFRCGYFWLGYSIMNYATACKSCNSTLKANYFPIGKQRGQKNWTISALRREEPLLIYPIGFIDSDPADLITFEGIAAIPRYQSGHKRRRAQVTIDFFRLNKRDLLLDERARGLMELGNLLEKMQEIDDRRKLRKKAYEIQHVCSSSASHAGCKRAFLKLWKEDNDFAKRIISECRERQSQH